MKKSIYLLIFCTICNNPVTFSQNLFTGTGKMGHTFPGATLPFGMVQLSPDTDTIPYEVNGKYNPDVYRYCAGYQYEDKTIVGFSHTHFSGTGHSDLGDILIMPTMGELQLNPGRADMPETGYRSRFSHDKESASPGYYSVILEDHNIKAELTASMRTGVHRYTFNESGVAHFILDMIHGIYNYPGKNIWTMLRVENDSTITGFRQTSGWARTRVQYFAIRFSKPFVSYGYKNYEPTQVYKGFWRKFAMDRNFPEIAGREIRAYFDFNLSKGEQIVVKVALSPTGTDKAMENLDEVAGKGFDEIRSDAARCWDSELGRVKATFISEEDSVNFFTAMYHSMLSPTIYDNLDGSYKGLDQNTHAGSPGTNYTTFSLWDTFRALHPWFNIINPSLSLDILKSMHSHYKQSVHKMLPVWSHHGNENWCMTGYHSVSVVSDALLKGVAGPLKGNLFADSLLEACISTANCRYYDGLDLYIKYGYVPDDLSSNSVSKTLEYAYDDWCIYKLAKAMGREEIAQQFAKRSESWRTLYDKERGLMRPKSSDGKFVEDFDPLDTHQRGFIEGNSWNYSLFVPHDPESLCTIAGGKKRFALYLDSLFTMYLPDKYFEKTEDITRDGIMGNYVHGNEPSHHVPYLFNYCGEPWKTQKYVRQILAEKYHPGFDGLSGNDDCGQMSAWYIFSSLGFYPISPGSERYELGSPLVKSAVITIPGGKEFVVNVRNQSKENIYVKRVLLNQTELRRSYITHREIINGGSLEFIMSSKPNKTLYK